MENTKELILVYASMKSVVLSQSVNIMLTPQFYTLKKELLPLKYSYQAKKIAPSLFVGLLEEGGNYDYVVSKEEDGWSFIAYDIEKIVDFLNTKGIESEQVSKIFFAQQSVDSFINPLIFSQKEALVVLDDTVVIVPRAVLAEEGNTSAVFNNSFTPKGGISLPGREGSLFSLKQASLMAGVFMLFALMFFIEGLRYGGDREEIESEMQMLLEDYPALQSSYTRKGIVSKYRGIDKAERSKRDAIKAFSGMIFKGVTLTSLHVDEKSFKAQFRCASAQVSKRVKALAKKEQYKIFSIKGSNDLRIEGTL